MEENNCLHLFILAGAFVGPGSFYDASVSVNGWTARDIPDQTGKVFVITGANSGLGLEAAKVLAQRGAHLVMAVRRPDAGAQAAAMIRTETPGAEVTVEACDLANLDSIAKCADRLASTVGRIDVVVNNAGIMAVRRGVTADGHERQLGTNHLGHFALTGHLLPLLLESENGRVVTVSSDMHRFGRIDPANLNGERYRRWGAYGRSKLANLLFAYELDRRSRAAGAALSSVACHPGYAATNLQSRAAREEGKSERFWRFGHLFAQSASDGALPTLRAATDTEAAGGSYFGPAGRRGGPATVVRSSARSHDTAVAEKLWEASERLTGVRFRF
jgi:NAD(P)-dependent dehydrogenase (short-subunit alcohol dehydrogenase family)